MDKIVHTLCKRREQCFRWTVNSSLESMDNLTKVLTKLSTSSVKDVNSVLGKSVLHDIVTLPWKCGQYVYKCEQYCPHLKSNGKQYTWTVFLFTRKCRQFYLNVDNIVYTFYKLDAQYNIAQKPIFTQKPTQKPILPRPLSANLVHSITLT